MHRDIENDLFDIIETYCDSCKFNIMGCTFCSKYPSRKPSDIMAGKVECKFYSILDNEVTAGILGSAIGDALGVPVEFVDRTILEKHPINGMIGMGTHKQQAGTWSDDTSMTIALIKGLRQKSFNIDYIAQKFLDWYKKGVYTPNGEVFDIGEATQRALIRVDRGVRPEDAGGKSEMDNGNGSLMRILPMAYYLKDEKDIERRKTLVYAVSAITHGHIRSKVACHIWVEMIIKILNGFSLDESYSYIINEVNEYYMSRLETTEYDKFYNIFSGTLYSMDKNNIKSSGYVIDSLEAAIWCLLNSHSYREAVLLAVNLGGDTDTIGALTGGVAGIIYGLESIPNEWKSELVNSIIINNTAIQLYRKCYKSNSSRMKEHLMDTYRMSAIQAEDTYNYLREYSDLYEEYLIYMRKKDFPKHDAICIEGYTAERLYKETYLQPIGAYNYLVYLRHNTQDALKKLEHGLPRK